MITRDLLEPIAPALVLAALFLGGIPMFALWVWRNGYPRLPDMDRRESTTIATRFLQCYVYALLTPLERLLARLGVSPNIITLLALGLCILAGYFAAEGRFAATAWIYLSAGLLDVLDGRVARRTGKTSRSGGLLDSVADRWGELFVLGGLVLAMPDRFGELAVVVCIAGSVMVSYTRARAEAAGVTMAAGTMQRAERITLTSAALLATAVALSLKIEDAYLYLAIMLLAIGFLSSTTAIQRLYQGFVQIRAAERTRELDVTPASRAKP
jgi:CDP-diacylglycerol---glycerol-3-phosphate 3-phosphatidyltransferase